ncbi:hypothetical protein ACFPOE_14450 [Caenimonas terrae]|uniref:Ig-like domain-containing protein n=1 Tax=Caenimonas terrae TaxID=696074 RepID=A0ABW0NII1_9BURK
MRKHLLSQAAALCLLAHAGLFSLPASAAGTIVVAAAPQTSGLEVNADNGVAAGSQLRLTLQGTPGGQASARIPGLDAPLALRETAPGQYSARYTVRRADRIDPAAVIKVSLTAAGRTAVANYTFPPSFMAPVAAAPAQPLIVAPPSTIVVQSGAAPLRIERFALAPLGRAEPGAELQFGLTSVPGATAWLDIPGVATHVPMRETRPGHYEGTYTVRQHDNLAAAGPVTATLRADDNRIATATLSLPLVSDHRPPQIGNLLPRQGESVGPGPTLVSGTFDATGSGVDPQSVRITVSGRDVTSLAQITPREFSLRDRLPPGHHTVEVMAADRAGNVAQKSWSFDVGSSVLGAPTSGLPLAIVSHQNNGYIGTDVTTIRGHTVPFASVRVQVDAVPPTGRRYDAGVAQRLLSESVQADANGDFAFDFNPRYVRDNASSLPVPGTRYDLSVTANRDNATTESRLMLFQRS